MKMLEKTQNENNIIVVVKLNSEYRYFISNWELWILNYEKYLHLFDLNDNDFSGRFDIGILNENSINTFLNYISADEIDLVDLKSIFNSQIPLNSWEDSYHLFPSLFVDFDNKNLLSLFIKEFCFENYLPKGWKGKYDDFFNLIPVKNKYWIIDNYDWVENFREQSI